ncbi:hypothetical protein CDAR_170371 [Caerostris darwini]|uniref:Uncharacterized protein n=1 Tax=Caerostris darwini TaxID=1538125 RepID=A0AAV4R7Q5_9ARAC|nr:hypothetical protein CDAR_170371 [Caerostris darwini]
MQDDERSIPVGAMSWNCGFVKRLNHAEIAIKHLITNRLVLVSEVGDEATGKSCLIRAFTNIRIKDPLLPSFEYVYTYTHRIMSGPLELKIVELRLEDLSLKEIKSLCRNLKHVFLFVFSVDNVSSAYRLERTWIACVKNALGPGVPSVLVCNKIDLRSHPFYSDKMHLLLDGDAVNDIRLSCGISSSFECSAVTGEMVELMFIGAAMLANKITPYF